MADLTLLDFKAARVGEQGRGFGVAAAELLEMSAKLAQLAASLNAAQVCPDKSSSI